MSKPRERFFHLLTFASHGCSYLHREHHACGDPERDPHSPRIHPNLVEMMPVTRHRDHDIQQRRVEPEAPEWPLIDRFGRTWASHTLLGALSSASYMAFAPSWYGYRLLPIHFLIGAVHGAIVNWCGHKYGYRNFDTTEHDKSRNTLVIDFSPSVNCSKNNRHKYGMSPNFAARWFEVDPTYPILRVLSVLGIIDLVPAPQRARFSASNPG